MMHLSKLVRKLIRLSLQYIGGIQAWMSGLPEGRHNGKPHASAKLSTMDYGNRLPIGNPSFTTVLVYFTSLQITSPNINKLTPILSPSTMTVRRG